MITLNQIEKLRDNRVILNNIDFSFCDNKKYLIFGESGVGKTTLLNIISTYEKPDSGTIYIDNKDKIEYLFQDTLLFSNITVKDNMIIKWLNKNENTNNFEKECLNILSLFSIEHLIETKVYNLSGGEKRRLELAQVLLSNPKVLLLDEPTANLDNYNKRLIIEIIKENFKDTIIILVSHDNKEYFNDYIFLELKEGKLYFE